MSFGAFFISSSRLKSVLASDKFFCFSSFNSTALRRFSLRKVIAASTTFLISATLVFSISFSDSGIWD